MMKSLLDAGDARPLEPAILLTAAVALVARQVGIRMLAIKGVAAAQYALRPPRLSSDVDVLVDPDRYEDLVETLEDRGWIQRHSDLDTATFPRHSVSLFHPAWGMDIDVHFRYPGIELTPVESFNRLWIQRTTLWCGNQPVYIPGFADAVLIAALHSLRGLWIDRHETELDALVERCRTVDAEQLVARARQLDALATSRPFLELLLPTRPGFEWGEASQEWQLRSSVSEPMRRRAFHWRSATWRERARQLRIALFPSVETLIKDSTHTHLATLPAARAYLRRWRRGLESLPKIVPILLGRTSEHPAADAPLRDGWRRRARRRVAARSRR